MTGHTLGPGSRVRVLALDPPGHVRAPWFLRGKDGVIVSLAARDRDPEQLAYGRRDGPLVAVWRVRFRQPALWADYNGSADDSLVADLTETWLEALP